MLASTFMAFVNNLSKILFPSATHRAVYTGQVCRVSIDEYPKLPIAMTEESVTFGESQK